MGGKTAPLHGVLLVCVCVLHLARNVGVQLDYPAWQ